jgi:hypothetical protein
MKPSHRIVLACLGLITGLALVASITSRPARPAPDRALTGGCPRHVRPAITFGPALLLAVTRAVKAQVPRVYPNLTSMGHPAWPDFQIQAIVVLNQLPTLGPDYAPRIRGLDRYEKLAARACGLRAANASVLVFLQFPNCQLPCSLSWAYLTRTRGGWHLWTSYQV